TITTSTKITERTTITTVIGTTITTSTTTPQILNTTLKLSCTSSSLVMGQSVKCGAYVFGGPNLHGWVTWSINGSNSWTTQYGTLSLQPGFKEQFASYANCALSPEKSEYGSDMCAMKFTPTEGGIMIINATYFGNSFNSRSSGKLSSPLNVTMRPTTTKVSCAPLSASVMISSHNTFSCKATVTGYSPEGNVSWSQKGTGSVSKIPTCTLPKGRANTKTCRVSLTTDTAGTVYIAATYGGDKANNGSSGEFPKPLTIS